MPYFDSPHRRAAALVILLGVGVTMALAPFITGLIGAPVLYVIFAPLYRLLRRWLRPSLAALLVVLVGILVVVVPISWVVVLMANETPGMVASVLQSPFLERIKDLRLGRFEVGPELEQAGTQILQWIGANAFTVLGSVTRTVLNLVFAFFGLYFLVQNPGNAWRAVRPYVPFSEANTQRLQERFRAVTVSTLIGTGLAAAAQGLLMAIGFMMVGIPNAWFWGVVTMVLAILPVVGSGLVYLPGVAWLIMDSRPGAALVLAIYGFVVVANVDNVIRPLVYQRYAQIHPLLTLIGAIAGVSYFGLLGLLLGPLALSYFFELLRMYGEEYVTPAGSQQTVRASSEFEADPPETFRPPAG
ncbi:MAG TPA: AI-2E family transporter [Gemmatimonadales bacterium]|nr:AI-2E family transporter [Gemmatimonadales bacterium]